MRLLYEKSDDWFGFFKSGYVTYDITTSYDDIGGGVKFRAEEFILSQTGMVMSLFFMMSGYCLYKSEKKIDTFLSIGKFYKKRALRVLPIYWIVEFYLLIAAIATNTDAAYRIKIFPVRLLCMQIYYGSSVFGGVGWFISCLVTCYILYPIISIAVDTEFKKIRMVFIWLIIFLLFYTSPLENWIGRLDTYYNPYFRFLEFGFGIIIAKFSSRVFKNIKRSYVTMIIFLIICVASLVCIELIRYNPINNYVKYFLKSLILISAGEITLPARCRISIIIAYISSFTFDVFILQDVLFSKPIREALAIFSGTKQIVFYFISLAIIIGTVRILMWGLKKLWIIIIKEKAA